MVTDQDSVQPPVRSIPVHPYPLEILRWIRYAPGELTPAQEKLLQDSYRVFLHEEYKPSDGILPQDRIRFIEDAYKHYFPAQHPAASANGAFDKAEFDLKGLLIEHAVRDLRLRTDLEYIFKNRSGNQVMDAVKDGQPDLFKANDTLTVKYAEGEFYTVRRNARGFDIERVAEASLAPPRNLPPGHQPPPVHYYDYARPPQGLPLQPLGAERNRIEEIYVRSQGMVFEGGKQLERGAALMITLRQTNQTYEARLDGVQLVFKHIRAPVPEGSIPHYREGDPSTHPKPVSTVDVKVEKPVEPTLAELRFMQETLRADPVVPPVAGSKQPAPAIFRREIAEERGPHYFAATIKDGQVSASHAVDVTEEQKLSARPLGAPAKPAIEASPVERVIIADTLQGYKARMPAGHDLGPVIFSRIDSEIVAGRTIETPRYFEARLVGGALTLRHIESPNEQQKESALLIHQSDIESYRARMPAPTPPPAAAPVRPPSGEGAGPSAVQIDDEYRNMLVNGKPMTGSGGYFAAAVNNEVTPPGVQPDIRPDAEIERYRPVVAHPGLG